MSKVLTDESTESSTVPSYESRMAAIKADPHANAAWQLTGDEDAAELLIKKSDVPAESSTAHSATPEVSDEVETETDSEPGETTIEQSNGTSRNGKQASNWAKLRQERDREAKRAAVAEAKAELLERQLAERTPKETVEPKRETGRPKLPRLRDDMSVEAYDAALDKYESDLDAYNENLIESRFQRQTQNQEVDQRSQGWSSQVTAAKSKFKDFEAVAFNPDTPISNISVGAIQSHASGAEISYYLGKNREEAQSLAELTEISGNYRNVSELMEAASKDPQLAMMVGEKRALAKVELDRIAKVITGKTAPNLKKIIAGSPKPTSEASVVSNAAAVGDEAEEALRKGDTQGYMDIMNRRDSERWRSGRR